MSLPIFNERRLQGDDVEIDIGDDDAFTFDSSVRENKIGAASCLKQRLVKRTNSKFWCAASDSE